MDFVEVSKIIKNLDEAFVLTDNDLDGISSGVLMRIILNKLRIRNKVKIRDHGKLDYNSLKKAVDWDYKNVILLDSPFKDDDIIKAAKEFEGKIIYIDHHKREIPKDLPENLIYFDVRALKIAEISVAGIVYRIGREIFGEEFKKYSWIAAIGAIGDFMYEKDKILREDFESTYSKIYLKAPLFFLYEIIMYGREKLFDFDPVEEFHRIFEKDFVKALKGNFEEMVDNIAGIKQVYKSNNVEVYESRAPSLVSTIIGSLKSNKVIVCYNKIGRLWKKKVKVSLRFQNANALGIDLGKFAEKFTKKYGIQGGGHPQAAGMLIKGVDLVKLINDLEDLFRKKIK